MAWTGIGEAEYACTQNAVSTMHSRFRRERGVLIMASLELHKIFLYHQLITLGRTHRVNPRWYYRAHLSAASAHGENV